MPPKNDGGKKKLSKAEKEKLKKDEAEKKAQEEEESKRVAQEEEKKRQEVELLQTEERMKQENEEKKERKVQMNELFAILECNKKFLIELLNKRRKDLKWERYMMCDGTPDPTVPGEINTYINLRLESEEKRKPMASLQLLEKDKLLIDELLFWLSHPEDLLEADKSNYNEAIVELQNLMGKELDDTTLQILCNATELQDTETYNLQHAVKTESICLCIWGNLSKKRIKPFEFTERGFTFDIPRILALTDCAFRILFTKYDHLSYQSKAMYPKQKQKVPEEPVEPEVQEEQATEKEVEQTEENGEEGKLEREETQDVMAELQNLDEEDGEDNEKEGEEENTVEVEEEDNFEDPATPEPTEWEDFDEDDDIIDLRAYHSLGGIISFDLIELPPQPKLVKSWTITALVNPPTIKYMLYVADNASLSPVQKDVKEGQEEKKREDRPPISVSYKLPEDIMFVDEPLPGRWDPELQHWRQDGFSDVKFDEEKRLVQFKTSYFGKLALFQDAHINMPFQSWEIRPRNVNNCILTIIAAVIDIQIEIKDALCCLTQPTDKIEVSSLLNKWMDPASLIKALKTTGVNIFPAKDSSKFVNVQNKDTLLEERIYEQIALTSSIMAYSWSKWNADADKRSIIYLGSESLNDEPLLEEDWSVFKSTKTRAMKLKMTEISDELNDELAENTEFRSNLYHLMEQILSEEGKNRLSQTDYQYINCVQQLLIAVKVLTYA